MPTEYDFKIAEFYSGYKDKKFFRSHYYLGTQFVLKEIGEIAGKYILDFGCGNGFESNFLARKGAKIIGFDCSQGQIDYARLHNHHPNVTFLHTPIHQLKEFIETEKKFDIVMANFVFCTIENDDEILSCFKAIASLIKPNGRLILLHNNPEESDGKNFVSWDCRKGIKKEHGAEFLVTLHGEQSFDVIDYYRSNRFYEELLNKAGFELVKLIKPLGAADQSELWDDEVEVSPVTIFVAAPARSHTTQRVEEQPIVRIES